MQQIDSAIQHLRLIPVEDWPTRGELHITLRISDGRVMIAEYSPRYDDDDSDRGSIRSREGAIAQLRTIKRWPAFGDVDILFVMGDKVTMTAPRIVKKVKVEKKTA